MERRYIRLVEILTISGKKMVKDLWVRPRDIMWMRWDKENRQTNLGIGQGTCHLAVVVEESPEIIFKKAEKIIPKINTL